MRKNSLFLVLMLLVGVLSLSLTSCKNGKSSGKFDVNKAAEKYVKAPTDSFSAGDTTEVRGLVDQFLGRLNDKQIGEAVNMLYYLNGDTIIPLPNQLRKRQTMTLLSAQGIRYEVEKLVFDREKDSEVKVNIILFEKEEGDPRPNTIGMYIKPVRRDGKWYLTMADTMTDTNQLHGTEIPN